MHARWVVSLRCACSIIKPPSFLSPYLGDFCGQQHGGELPDPGPSGWDARLYPPCRWQPVCGALCVWLVGKEGTWGGGVEGEEEEKEATRRGLWLLFAWPVVCLGMHDFAMCVPLL